MNIHQPIIVMVSFPNREIALEIAKQLIEKRLIACAQFSAIESMYRWQNQLENSREVMMHAKSIHTYWPAIHASVKELHPYEVPEIIVTSILEIEPSYFQWMLEELGQSGQQLYV
jgi:periplasmic divalent cation tolerance protein